MVLRCRHRGCKTVLQGDVQHIVYLRMRAKKLGWGYSLQVNQKTFQTRAFDYCPEHACDVGSPGART